MSPVTSSTTEDAPDVTVRRLVAHDIPAAELVAHAALHGLARPAWASDQKARRARGWAPIAHLRSTDAGGAFVAERYDTIVGVAMSLIRDDLWFLSLLAVHPGLQSRGVGHQLLAAALDYGAPAGGAVLISSPDPRAVSLYLRFGFWARPCLSARGRVRQASIPTTLHSRPGTIAADRALVDATSQEARGAAHGADIDALLAARGELLVHDGGGYAVHDHGEPLLLAASSIGVAADLLWASLAQAPADRTVSVQHVTEANNWALDVAVTAGLEVRPSGPMFLRGDVPRLCPYLPSGRYL
jgi:GNAT superfamily N-acetyltransferase